MKTVIEKISKTADDIRIIQKAAEIIKSGGLVAFPTETVYGLGADALTADAASKIYKAKGRPSDNPLIIHISKAEDAEKYAHTSELYYKLTKAFSPGPLTIIMPKKDIIPDTVTGGLDTVAVRIPSNETARAIIECAETAIAAPSANTSGKPSPTEASHVIEDLNGKVDMIIDGGECDIGLESTVIKLNGDGVVLLRPGAVDEEMLRCVCHKVTVSDAILQKLKEGEKAESPGMMYKHYAPDVPVYLVDGDEEKVIEFFKERLTEDSLTGILCYSDCKDTVNGKNVKYLDRSHTSQAHVLFGYLRGFNNSGASAVYSVIPDSDGVGLAVLNRLVRASGFRIINV